LSTCFVEYQTETRKLSAWSEERLPFEPTGQLLAMRDKIRLALQTTPALPSEILHAKYYCRDSSVFDVENILFYNVGTGAFQESSQNGLRFQRFTHLPRHPNSRFRYLQQYTLEENLEPLIDESRPYFTVRFKVPKLNTATKPHEIWWYAKSGFTEGNLPDDWGKNRFVLSLLVSTRKTRANWASYLKPLIDGIVSIFNYQSSSAATLKSAQLIAQNLNVEYHQVLSLLTRKTPDFAALKDNLVTPYRNFIKWNPSDDLCFGAEIIPTLTTQDDFGVTALVQYV